MQALENIRQTLAKEVMALADQRDATNLARKLKKLCEDTACETATLQCAPISGHDMGRVYSVPITLLERYIGKEWEALLYDWNIGPAVLDKSGWEDRCAHIDQKAMDRFISEHFKEVAHHFKATLRGMTAQTAIDGTCEQLHLIRPGSVRNLLRKATIDEEKAAAYIPNKVVSSQSKEFTERLKNTGIDFDINPDKSMTLDLQGLRALQALYQQIEQEYSKKFESPNKILNG